MDLALVVLMGLAAAYWLRALMLIERDNHYGPFRSTKRFVHFSSSGHTQPVVLFDWIRRLAGVYDVSDLYWDVREGEEAAERFTCPFCLSFWVASPFSIGLAVLWMGISLKTLLIWFPIHFAIAIVSQVVYKLLWDDKDEATGNN